MWDIGGDMFNLLESLDLLEIANRLLDVLEMKDVFLNDKVDTSEN